MRWLGVEALKCPMDLIVYQELLVETRPDLVIEGGTCSGGTTLFIATILEALGHGRVVTVDWDADPSRPVHPRITYLVGNTLDDAIVDRVFAEAVGTNRRMLILDDGHSWEHVHEELKRYAPVLSSVGDVLIVEDTDLGGPYWGLQNFLRTEPDDRWERIGEPDRFRMTFNPHGYWRRRA